MAFDYSSSFAGINNSLARLGQQNELAYKNQSLANLGQKIQSGDFDGAAQAAFAAGDAGTGIGLLKLQQTKQQEADWLKSNGAILGGGIPSQSVAAVGQPKGYFATTANAESTNNPAAKNPNSSATGLYQFTDGTWADVAKANPQLGLTPDGRTDPVQQQKAMQAFTAQNAKILQSQGIQPTDGNLYMAHFLGAGAAPNFIQAVQQDPSVPAVSLVSPQAAAANRSVFFNQDGTPKSAGEVYQQMAGRYGNGSTAIAALQGQGQAGAPFQVAQAAPQPGAPVSDVPAQGAAEAQFVLPGTDTAVPQSIANDPRVIGLQRALAGAPDRYKASIQARLNTVVEDLKAQRQESRPTDETRNFEQFRREEVAAGRPPPSRADYLALKRSRTEVSIDQKGETKFEEALGTAQAKRWNGYIDEGDKAQARLADIQTLRETSRRLGAQGSSANLKSVIGPYAESLGIKVEGLPDIQLYEAITQRLAPQLRAPGSGSTSDIEFKGFQRAIGPLSNNPAAREMILDTFEAASRNDIARSQIASRLASGEVNRGQAEKELRALPNPMEGFREFRKQNPDLVGQALKQSAMRQSAEKRDPVRVSSPDEARKLPSGTRIILPDGRPGQVP